VNCFFVSGFLVMLLRMSFVAFGFVVGMYVDANAP
jgi:hypothetical protein